VNPDKTKEFQATLGQN